MMKRLIVLFFPLVLAACGGGGSSGSVSGATTPAAPASTPQPPVSVASTPIAVHGFDTGDLMPAINRPYVTVTVCNPTDPSKCVTIPNIMLDTGSAGLRIFPSAAAGLDLPSTGMNECVPFVNAATWGPVDAAKVTVAGVSATVPIQVIDPHTTQPIPVTCSGYLQTPQQMGANGLLGVSVNPHDCGGGCAGSANNLMYYDATTGENIAVPRDQQVTSPLYAAGVPAYTIDFPDVPFDQTSVTGALELTAPKTGWISAGSAVQWTINYGDQQGLYGILDTGTSSYWVNLPSTLNAVCALSTYGELWMYSPTQPIVTQYTVSQGASPMAPAENATSSGAFTVSNACNDLLQGAVVSPYLGTSVGTATMAGAAIADFGMPFFYGKKVSFSFFGTPTGPAVAIN